MPRKIQQPSESSDGFPEAVHKIAKRLESSMPELELIEILYDIVLLQRKERP